MRGKIRNIERVVNWGLMPLSNIYQLWQSTSLHCGVCFSSHQELHSFKKAKLTMSKVKKWHFQWGRKATIETGTWQPCTAGGDNDAQYRKDGKLTSTSFLSRVFTGTVKRSLNWRRPWSGWGTWRPCSTLKMLPSPLPWGRSEPWRLRWKTSRPSWPR